MTQIQIITYRAQALIGAPKIHTDLLWDFTFLFVGLAVLYFTGVFFFRNRISSQTKKLKLRKDEFSPMISEFLFYDDNAPKDEKTRYIELKLEIRQLLKDDFNRKSLAEILLDLRKDVSGDTQQRLFKLYKDLGLHKDAYQKLKSWRWERVSKGILELTQMQVVESYNLITKFINDRRSTIRKQAEIATVTLKPDGITYFLDTTRYKISEWQQLKILDVLRNFEDFQPPRFKAWLTSTNRHVVLFALRLIKYYNQNDVNASLVELVKHKNDQIKTEALNCIKEFNVFEAIETLEIVFWKNSVDLKISILDVIATIGNNEHLQFLELIEKKERNFSVKSKALSAINAISPESVLPTVGIMDITNYQIPPDIVSLDTEEPEEGIPEFPKASDEAQELHEEIETNEKPIGETQKDTQDFSEMVEAGQATYDEIKKDEIAISVNDIEVKGHQIISDTEETQQKPKEIEALENPKPIDEDLQDINLGFLPIVVSSDLIDSEIESEEDRQQTDSNSLEEPRIENIPVVYELLPNDRVSFERKTDSIEPTSVDEINISELNFLPIVVEVEPEHDENTASSEYRYTSDVSKELKKERLLETKVFFEEIKSVPEYRDMAVVYEIMDVAIPKNDCKNSDPSSVSTIDYDQIRNLEVHFEEMASKSAQFPIEESLQARNGWDFDTRSDVESLSDENNVVSQLGSDYPKDYQDEQDDIKNMIGNIPNSSLYDENTRKRMNLLDDIDELGDEREIPLLLEYLKEEQSEEIKRRIGEIISKFSHSEIEQLQQSEKSSKVNYDGPSTIEILFQECDEDSQMILLDCSWDLMDEKDIDFLKKLINNVNPVINEKAEMILEDIQEKALKKTKPNNSSKAPNNDASTASVDLKSSSKLTENLETEEDQPSDPKDIFDIGFEIALEEEEENEETLPDEDSNNENSIVGCLLSIKSLILETLHG